MHKLQSEFISALAKAKPFIFDTVRKLFQSSIFSVCHIFELGTESKLPEAESIVPESTKFAGGPSKS